MTNYIQLSVFDLPLNPADPYETIKPPTPEIIYRLRKLPNCSKSSIFWAFIGKTARQNWEKLQLIPPSRSFSRSCCISYGPHRSNLLPPTIQPYGTWHFIIQDISCPKDFLPLYHSFQDLK